MDYIDQLGLRGILRVRVYDVATGKRLQHEEKRNLVCKGAKEALVRLIAQASIHGGSPTNVDFEETKLWAIYAGTGTALPDVEDTELDTVAFKKECVQPIAFSILDGEATLQMTIESGEGNGNTFQEAGLFSRGDNDDPNAGGITGVLMYARQLHGAIAKTSGISIEYTWRFQILV